MELFKNFVDILSNLFTNMPWLFPICMGLFFVLTLIGAIFQSSYEENHHVDR